MKKFILASIFAVAVVPRGGEGLGGSAGGEAWILGDPAGPTIVSPPDRNGDSFIWTPKGPTMDYDFGDGIHVQPPPVWEGDDE